MLGRPIKVVALAISLVVTLSSTALALPLWGDVTTGTRSNVTNAGRGRAANHEDGHPACRGIANAFAHVSANQARNANHGNALAALTRVADMLGCDLALAAPIDDDLTDTEDETDTVPDETGPADVADPKGPPAWVVEKKCDKIAAKLAEAQARPHGKSAEAFARQAERWGCSD